MNKHRYQANDLQRVDWVKLGQAVEGQTVTIGVDVAKEDFYGAFLRTGQEVLAIITWRHPQDTPALGAYLVPEWKLRFIGWSPCLQIATAAHFQSTTNR